MAFVNINKRLEITLTEYGKEKLITGGDIGFKYFSIGKNDINIR